MSLFWRKTNRGLWLGLVLILALIVFIIVTEVSYGLQKKEIRATAKEYAEALLQINVVQGELGEDGYLNVVQKNSQKLALKQLAREYWYSGNIDLNSRNYDFVQLNALLEQWQKDVPGKVTAISCKPENWEIDIQRDGPERVLVSLTTDLIEVHGKGAAPKEETEEGILFPTSVSGRVPGDGTEWTRSCTVYFSFEMVRRDGKWQIAGMNATTGYGYYYNYGLLGLLG